MQLTDRDVAKIPPRNLHVGREDFVAVWRDAERIAVDNWYAAGVVMACRWIATATVRSSTGAWYMAESPVTQRAQHAYEELIQQEYVQAERLQFRRPRPEWLSARDGWIDGVAATFRWAWGRRGGDPLDVPAMAGLR